MSVQIGDVATWAAAIVAVLSMIITLIYSRKNMLLLAEQQKLEKRMWMESRHRAIEDWAIETTNVLSEVFHCVEMDILDKERQFLYLSKLSALVDSGRWYFPNEAHEEYGLHKEGAFRGLRAAILDPLVGVYNRIKTNPVRESLGVIEKARRDFTSEIQQKLAAREKELELAKAASELNSNK